MNRTDRLMAIVTYLQGRRVVRAEELARHFEVSERTVYRDIAALGESGIPIVGEAGVGYSLVKGYHLPPVMFTAEEAMALALSEDLVKQFTDGSVVSAMAAALLKIRSVLPRDRQDELDRLTAATAIEARRQTPTPIDQRILLPLQQAIVTRHVVRVEYRSAQQEDSRRDIEPLGVVYYGDAWYLVCWCRLRQDFRHLKLSRIGRLEVLAERFAARPDFTLEAHLRQARLDTPATEVRLWFADEAWERARRESCCGFEREQVGPEAGRCVSLRVYSDDWLVRWILSFGAAAEVLEPVRLRQAVAERARLAFEKHAESVFS